MRLARWSVLVVVLALPAVGGAAQLPLSPTAIYRVFLSNGTVLPSYGEVARVGDRLIFNLAIVRADARVMLQLMSLPASIVDVERTARYAQAMRARVYAATRGEAEYAAMLASFGEELSAIAALEDRPAQMARAQSARQRLSAWPADHFNYRAADLRRLVGLLDDVLRDVPVAGGPVSFALDLSSDAGDAMLPPPRPEESIEWALAAAATADVGEERIAILRAASAATADEAVRRRVAAQLERELEAELRYAALANEFRRRADSARRVGNVRSVERLQAELPARDAGLGGRRPQQVQSLARQLGAVLDATRTRRAALDRFYAVANVLAAYERGIRPAFSGMSALEPLLTRVRDLERVPYEQTLSAERRLQRWRDLADALTVPEDVAGIHATVVSAVRMAQEACVRRRLADVTTRETTAREASSAAAGALLLADRARADLLAALLPPRD